MYTNYFLEKINIKNCIILCYIYLLFGLLFVIYNKELPGFYVAFIIFMLLKWILNYRKCTFSYIECKIRNVKKKDGILYNFLENLVNIRNTNHCILLIVGGCTLLYYHFIVKKNELNL